MSRDTSNYEAVLKTILIAAMLTLSAAGAQAANIRSAKAIDKNGKPLAGAAMTSFMNNCTKDATACCEVSAKDKNGKLLTGAAKTSYAKKCVSDVVAG